MAQQTKLDLSLIPQQVVQIITNPVGFFQQMPRRGGYLEPLVFMLILGVIAGFIQTIVSIIGLLPVAMRMGIEAIIIMPVLIVIFGFISAGILYLIWKVMGSPEPYETAYRCVAYSTAIVPVTALLSIIPYLGAIIGVVWMSYLMIVASTEVHGINPKTATAVFGIIGLLFVIINVSSEYTARQMTEQFDGMSKSLEGVTGRMEDMTPEEAGEAAGKFLKGLEKTQRNEREVVNMGRWTSVQRRSYR